MDKIVKWYMRNFGVRSGYAHDIGTWIVGVAVGVVILASVIGVAITQLENVDTSGWNPTVVTIFGVLSIIVIAGVILGVYKRVSGSGGR